MQDNDGVIAVKQIAIWCLIKIIRSFHLATHKLSTCLLLRRIYAVEMLFLEYHSYAEFVILSNLINCWQDSLCAFKDLCFCLPQKFSCNNISSVYAMKWKFSLDFTAFALWSFLVTNAPDRKTFSPPLPMTCFVNEVQSYVWIILCCFDILVEIHKCNQHQFIWS